MAVQCPKCRVVVPPADVQPGKYLARCGKCKEPFALDVPAVREKPPVPAGVRVIDDGITRRLAFRWFRPQTLLMVVVCVAWDAFLLWWFWNTVVLRPALAGTFIPIVHVAVGVAMKYRTLCELVNRTAVEVGDVLRVQHGPLFWPGIEVPASDVTAVVCVPVLHRGKGKGTARVSFTLRAMTESGPTLTLLTGFDSLPRAQFFEWQIEDWLDFGECGMRNAECGTEGIRTPSASE